MTTHVECPFCYFRFSVDLESGINAESVFCDQCENRFVGEKIKERIFLDAKNVPRHSGTSGVLLGAGVLFLIVAGATFIGETKDFLSALSIAGVGLVVFAFGKHLQIQSDTRWFAKIRAEREFRKKG